MTDYYAEFLDGEFFRDDSDNQLTKPTKVPVEVNIAAFVSSVSSFSEESEKKRIEGHDVSVEYEKEIIRAAQAYLQDRKTTIGENEAVAAYTAKLELVRADPDLIAVFHNICEEREAILIFDGLMTENYAEASVMNIQFLTRVLIMV